MRAIMIITSVTNPGFASIYPLLIPPVDQYNVRACAAHVYYATI
jgi:hypothetical protein